MILSKEEDGSVWVKPELLRALGIARRYGRWYMILSKEEVVRMLEDSLNTTTFEWPVTITKMEYNTLGQVKLTLEDKVLKEHDDE